jgi:BirA family biotin operon repressor/biotin-[acetyl-CoA-carboxylase] ligase
MVGDGRALQSSLSSASLFMLDVQRLASSGLVARVDYHPSLGSTSDRALELAAEGDIALPLLVVTERQTAGRGRGTNRWWTTEGALTFSLILEAPPTVLPPDRWPQVALVAGLAVCEAMGSLAPQADLRLKWPNDIFLSGRKLGGILSESAPGWGDRLVVGVGINVNNQMTAAAGEWQPSAIALIDHDGLARDLTGVLLAVLDHFDRRWNELPGGSFPLLAAAYRQRCFLTGKTITIVKPGGEALIGVCGGIDDFGALRLHTETGCQSLISGTILRWQDAT